jgi:hypothetical protein
VKILKSLESIPPTSSLTGNQLRDALLSDLTIDIHPCGSRALGTEEPGSDWDYVVTRSTAVHRLLATLGFRAMHCARVYDSSYVDAVYEIFSADGQKIQVSVEVDADYKRRIIETLRSCKPLRDFDKALRASPKKRDELWASLYALAGFEGGV